MEHTAQRAVDTLIAKYSESHLHPVNEIIHFICVPAIMFSILGFLWAVHPMAAIALTVASLIYYFMLSNSFAIGMLIMSGVMLWALSMLPQTFVWQSSLAIFVIAWIGQFIGHKVEGKKPSFFDDVRFLLIGPLFVLSFLYRRLNIQY
jgi:uncharacterized membrane protein YGL010W